LAAVSRRAELELTAKFQVIPNEQTHDIEMHSIIFWSCRARGLLRVRERMLCASVSDADGLGLLGYGANRENGSDEQKPGRKSGRTHEITAHAKLDKHLRICFNC
jgi:hypothetical protein